MNETRNKAGTRHPAPDTRALFQRAQQLQEAGRPEEALSLYRNILMQDPAHGDAHFLLGAILARKGDVAAARGHMEQAVRLRPQIAEFHQGLGLLYLREKRLAEAVGQDRVGLGHPELDDRGQPHDRSCPPTGTMIGTSRQTPSPRFAHR